MTPSFEVEPYRKVTIRTIQNFDTPEAFFESLAGPVPPGAKARFGPVLWANGVVFMFAGYTPSDALSREHLSGHLPWDNLDFAPLSKFQKEVKVDGREIVIFLKDVSKHSLFGPLTKWLSSEFLGRRVKR